MVRYVFILLILMVLAGCTSVVEVGPLGVQSRIYDTLGIESGSDVPMHPMLKGQNFENEGKFICTAMTLLDPFLMKTDEERRVLKEMRPHVLKIYEQIATDDVVQALPSALPYCMSGKKAGGLHTFLFAPEDNARKPAPVIVFLHGGIGNYKFYLYNLLKHARRTGTIIACPTLSGGQWREAQGRAIVGALVEKIKQEYYVDADRLFLAGISDGAQGVWHLGGEKEFHFTGLISIAGNPRVDFELNYQDHPPTLSFMGTSDQYYSVEMGREIVKSLKDKKQNITYVEFENEDHFFMLRRSADVFKKIFDWIELIAESR